MEKRDSDVLVESREDKLRKLEDLSIPEIKDNIITALRRLAQAEEDKKYYTKSYNEVIKEEKETITELRQRLEFLYESNRQAAAEAKWIAQRELRDVVDDKRDAIEQDDKERLSVSRGFLRTADGESYDPETGELQGDGQGQGNVVPLTRQ